MVQDGIRHIRNNIDTYLTIFPIVIIGIFLATQFDFYYDINDDVLIHDILSGNYTGVPEGHNIQMLYPLSVLIAMCYKGIREIPWYGFFLCGCQFGCFYLIIRRTLTYGTCLLEKIFLLATSTSLFLLFQYNTLVMVQYTVVAGLLASTSIFLLLTSEEAFSIKEMLKENRQSIILLLIAFCLREEITLLLLPMLCVAGVGKWIYEKKLWSRQVLQKYCILLGVFIGGLLLCMGIHKIAYSNSEWRTFQEFFAQRTKLYDYATIPEYEKHKDFYDEIGLKQSQQQLLVNYNYAIDSRIDMHTMTEIANYAMNIQYEESSFISRLRESMSAYKYRFLQFEKSNLDQSDYPYNIITMILYVMVVILVMITKKFRFGSLLALLVVVRSGLWLYIIYGLRTPVRITMPLYFAECCILFGILLELIKQKYNRKTYSGFVISIFLIAAIISNMSYLHQLLQDNVSQKEVSNQAHEDIRAYANLYPENLYLIDVYTYVPFSEKIFEGRNNLLDNYGIIGGWAAGSPLETMRLKAFDILEMDEALLEEEHVFFVNETKYSLTWLEDYYSMNGIVIKIESVAELTDGTIKVVKIYQAEE